MVESRELPKLTMHGLSTQFRIDGLVKRHQYKDLFTRDAGSNTHKLKVSWQTIFLSDFENTQY